MYCFYFQESFVVVIVIQVLFSHHALRSGSMQNTVLPNEGAAMCASWVAWFSVPGKGEP